MLRPPGLALFLSVFIAGCAGAPPPAPPLMSPLSEAKYFGYSERTVGPDQIEVTYLAPARRVALDRAKRAADIARARELAEDIALWRAAQVAMTRKARAFRVLNRRSDANLELRERIEGYPHYPFFLHRHPRDRRSRFSHYGFYRGYPYDPFLSIGRDARVQVQATVTIALLKRKGPRTIDPSATAARLRAKYPGALGAPKK
ncbi:MAG: hypothetical protein OEQ29_02605 [Alphaproteobacteria bacterium]|nr:hypothetical protein [Alphaproteobacteria bacterium]